MLSGRGSGRSQVPGGDTGRPLGSTGSCRARGGPCGRRDSGLARPGDRQPAEGARRSPIFPTRFTCSPRRWLPRRPRSGGAVRAARGPAGPPGLGQALLQDPGGFPGVLSVAPWWWDGTASARPGRGRGRLAGVASSEVAGRPGRACPGPPRGRSGHGLQGHSLLVDSETQREVGVGGRQVQAGQAVGGPGCSDSDEPGSSRLLSSRGSRSQTGADWSPWPRVAGWLQRWRLQGRGSGLEAGRRGDPGSVRGKRC